MVNAGRRLAKTPSLARKPSRPVSGLSFGGLLSYWGAPTAEQHGVARQAGLQRGFGQRLARFVQGRAADQLLAEFEFVAEFLRDCFETGDGLARHFNADAVAR